MTSRSLKDRLKNISKEKDVDFNTLLRLYMYERFIERLYESRYRDNFILKGGFYISVLFGIENRTTMDIDSALKNVNFSQEEIIKMIKEIIAINLNDNAKLSYLSIDKIREEDEYGGFRINLQVEIDKIIEKFHIDIATGDPITPQEISYKYKPLLRNDYINLWAYNLEIILAEKLETILSRVELNGRMKDFYDIYLIYTKDWDNINIDNLRMAIQKTFSKREYIGNIIETLNTIKNSNVLKIRWKSYQKKYTYAKDISFEDIMNSLEIMLNKINKVII